MPFCPICGYEYRQGIKTCPDCGVELIECLTPELLSEQFKVAYTTNSAPLAEMVKEALEQEKIHTILTNKYFSSQIGMTNPLAEVRIMVPEEKLKQAKEIIQTYFAEKTDTEEFTACGNCGARIEADALQCPFCGKIFEETD